MSNYSLKLENVSKKFKKGESFDSLRDLIPAMVQRGLKRKPEELGEREFWALQDIDFEVSKGEAFGIMGHNGAGKSTILKILCGIIKPTRGAIHVNGRLSALLEVGAGFHPDLTGRENIFLNGTILGMKKQEIRTKFDEIVEFAGLAEFIETPVKRYSSGMYARLGFSVAVHMEPDVLVVDEVLSVGDFVFQRKGVEKMNAVMRSGTTVIFVSHNLRAMANLCQRSLLINRGHMLFMGPTEDVIRRYMSDLLGSSRETRELDVYISRVSMRRDGKETAHFESGQDASVEIEVTARRACEGLGVVLALKDQDYLDVFNTSSSRLDYPDLNMRAGEVRRFRFDLSLHLAPGSFSFNLSLYHYAQQKVFDTIFPACTFYVSSPIDVRGVANLYPRISEGGLA